MTQDLAEPGDEKIVASDDVVIGSGRMGGPVPFKTSVACLLLIALAGLAAAQEGGVEAGLDGPDTVRTESPSNRADPAEASNADPQFAQNRASSGFSRPQVMQVRTAGDYSATATSAARSSSA